MASFNKFNQVSASVGNGVFDWNVDTLFLALFTAATAPLAQDVTYDSVTTFRLNFSGCTEVAGGNGYSAGGQLLGSTAYTQSGGVATLSCTSSGLVWTASGVGFSLRYIVIYDASGGSAAARPVFGWWDYGSTLTLAPGQAFTITAPSGVLTLS